jgi:hypothetical protein
VEGLNKVEEIEVEIVVVVVEEVVGEVKMRPRTNTHAGTDIRVDPYTRTHSTAMSKW